MGGGGTWSLFLYTSVNNIVSATVCFPVSLLVLVNYLNLWSLLFVPEMLFSATFRGAGGWKRGWRREKREEKERVSSSVVWEVLIGELNSGIPFLKHNASLLKVFILFSPWRLSHWQTFGKILRTHIPHFLLFLCIIKEKHFGLRSWRGFTQLGMHSHCEDE